MGIPFVNLAHLAYVLWMAVFPYITRKHDTLYLGLMCAMILSWSLCRGECIVSYLMKKYTNPRYVMGTRPDSNEVYGLISTTYLYEVKMIIRIMSVLTLAIVLWRNSYSAASILLLVGAFLGCNLLHLCSHAWYRAVCVVIYGAFGLQLAFPDRMARIFNGLKRWSQNF